MATRVPRAPTDKPPKKRAPRQIPSDEICPSDLQALFGRNLQTARLKLAMTLDDVAAATGMTNPYVSKVEHGRTNLTLSTMKKLAAVVSLEPGDMLKPLKSGQELLPPGPKKKPSL